MCKSCSRRSIVEETAVVLEKGGGGGDSCWVFPFEEFPPESFLFKRESEREFFFKRERVSSRVFSFKERERGILSVVPFLGV